MGGNFYATFHHFPFAGIFEESVPSVQVAWTQPGQIINLCWEIKIKINTAVPLVMRRFK